MAEVPVVIGIGEIKNASTSLADALEPAQLMLQAIHAALRDAASPSSTTTPQHLQASIDDIAVVRTWTWPYADLPGQLAAALAAPVRRKHYSAHGGNQPANIFDDAARRISKAEAKCAVVCGGEALASLTACAKAKKMPPPGWTAPEEDVNSVFSPTTRDLLGGGLGAAHGIGNPIHVYPLYENAFRARRGQTIRENHGESTRVYGDFARVAAHNEFAWNYGRPAETEESIGSVTGKNRMICFPYPLLMNAFNTVNLAAACILTSASYASSLGIPESHLIYPLGGAGTRDDYSFWQRPDFHSSPSTSRSLQAALRVSRLSPADIDVFDFYSCFPIVPKLACEYFRLDPARPQKPITVLGGLTSFGGAGNNYSMHALTEMVRRFRREKSADREGGDGQKDKRGLVHANGGVLTYQHVVCLGTRRPEGEYPQEPPLGEVVDGVSVPEIAEGPAEGGEEAEVETYTVLFARDNTPETGWVVLRLKASGRRTLAVHADDRTLEQLASWDREPIGRTGWVRRDEEEEGRNLFSFDESAKL